MAGTLITPSPAAGLDGPAGSKMTPSVLNSYRIAAAAEGLALHVRTPPKNDVVEFCNLCLCLARGIDYAVANNEAPDRVQDLPILLKQVCQCKNDSLLQAAVMVLMISVKNACKSGWFPTKDSEDLLMLAEEVGSSFCTLRDLNPEASNSHPIISTIMSRFYPQMKMGQILAFLEAKPGYGTFVVDFQISKNAKPSAEDKIRLFVAQTDKIETPSCIVSPQQVNFLLNGKGVERRTNVFMDAAPQLPTVVTQMLKFGTNLLQAVGQFCGNYIIVVAYMSMSSSANRSALLDYVQPAVAALDSDTEITEGPSRISLNCPISFRRIKTPVKGHSCKHLQCFDFDNYVDINSRRPSWRCPHCNQCVCYVDIRIDQNMVKILKEVGENVVDVIISADGSWKAALENNDNTDQPDDTTTNCQQDGLVQQKASSVSNIPPDIMDLTDGDDEMDVIHIDDLQDEKPDLANLQSQSSMNDTGVVNQNAAPIEDDFWSGIFLSTYGPGVSNARLDARLPGDASGSAPTNSMLSPVLTDAISPALNREPAISPALNREPEAFHETSLIAASIPQSQISVPSNLSLLQSQFGNSISSNEYGRVPSIARQINRTPIAVQALPAQNLTSVPQQRSRNSFNTSTPQGPSLASQNSALTSLADGYNTASLQIGRQQQYCRPHLSNPLQMSQMAPPSLPQHQAPSNWNHQKRSLVSSQAAQQIVGLPAPSQLPNAYKPSTVPITELQNSRQQSLNLRVPHVMSQSPTLARSSAQPPPHFPRNQIPQSGAVQTAVPGSSQRLMGSAQRAAQISRQHQTVPVSLQTTRAPSPSFLANASGFGASGGNTGGTLQSSTAGADGLADLPGEQDWRPTRRMRGSLSGRAYSDALNQLIIQPTPPVQAVARPPLNLTSILPPPGIPAPLHVLMANRDAHAAPRVVNYPSTESTSMASSPSALPNPSSGMH